MTSSRTPILVAAVAAAFLAGAWVASSEGAPTGQKKAKKKVDTAQVYRQGMRHVKQGDFEAALASFQKVAKKEPKNPDALNMIAYCHRKLGQLDAAFQHYALALEYREQFPQAREYLAEAHIQAALAQAQVLESYGEQGGAELAQVIKAFEAATESLNSAESMLDIELHRW